MWRRGAIAAAAVVLTAAAAIVGVQLVQAAGSGPGSTSNAAHPGPARPGATPLAPAGACPPGSVALPPGSDLQAALDDAPDGGAICVGAGVHRDQFDLRPRSGQKIFGEAGSVLDGSRPVTGFTAENGYWYADGQPTEDPGAGYAECQPEFPMCDYPDQAFVDDTPLHRVASRGDVGPGMWFYDYAGGRIYLGDDPAGRTVEVSQAVHSAITSSEEVVGVEIRGLTIQKYGPGSQYCAINAVDGNGGWATWSDADAGLSGGWVVEDNVVQLNHGCGIFAGNGSLVRNNVSNRNGQTGIKGLGAHILVEDNTSNENNWSGTESYFEAGGIKFSSANRDTSFIGNTANANNGPGLWTDYTWDGIVFDGNTANDNTDGGIQVEVTKNAILRNNTLSRNQAAGIFVYNSVIDAYNNVLESNNGGVQFQVQERGCYFRIEGRPCPPDPGDTTESAWHSTIGGSRIHDNDIEMDRGWTGLDVLSHQDYPPYSEHTAAWARQWSEPGTLQFYDNRYTGSGYDRVAAGDVYDDPDSRFLWSFPAGTTTDPENVYAYADQRYIGWEQWTARFGLDSGSTLR